MNLFILVIRNTESILTLARTDLVLLPSAYVLARAVFEIATKAAWLVRPVDPIEREVRWLTHLREEERLQEGLSVTVAKAGGDSAIFKSRHSQIRDFGTQVASKLPDGYAELQGNPSVEAMLDDLDQKQMYFLYRVLAQFVHGAHASTWLYRKGLGTLKEGGEFVSAGQWHWPLWTAWKNLQVFLESLLWSLKARTPDFLAPEEVLSIDQDLANLSSLTMPRA